MLLDRAFSLMEKQTPCNEHRTRIFLVEDHELMALGIRTIIAPIQTLCLIGECRDGETAVKVLPSADADIAIVNLGLPRIDGITVTRILNKTCERLKVIWFSAYPVVQFLDRARSLAVKGFLHKSCSTQEFVDCIQNVASGSEYYSKSVFTAGPIPVMDTMASSGHLSARQKEVLTLIGKGYINKEVATLLGMSSRTVETHCQSICKKLGLNSRAAMMRVAIKSGLSL